MAKPTPPVEVTQAEHRLGGFKHVSVFLAQAFKDRTLMDAKSTADTAPTQTPATVIDKDADPT